MRRFILMITLGWAALTIFITTQPGNNPLVELINHTLARTLIAATFGHAALFASMTLVSYLGLRTLCNRPLALTLAMLAALIVGTGTEFYQLLVAGRDASLTDLLANWLGVFVVGFALVSGMLVFPVRHSPIYRTP